MAELILGDKSIFTLREEYEECPLCGRKFDWDDRWKRPCGHHRHECGDLESFAIRRVIELEWRETETSYRWSSFVLKETLSPDNQPVVRLTLIFWEDRSFPVNVHADVMMKSRRAVRGEQADPEPFTPDECSVTDYFEGPLQAAFEAAMQQVKQEQLVEAASMATTEEVTEPESDFDSARFAELLAHLGDLRPSEESELTRILQDQGELVYEGIGWDVPSRYESDVRRHHEFDCASSEELDHMIEIRQLGGKTFLLALEFGRVFEI